ncbi:nitrate reductase [Sorangium sp. So ce185]|uniref:molybdopterin oxidoreductase family protein n=1 Tax=Sorangium sp. So ce185 TaxID=3133287 RepID=UPI003F62638D
MAQTRNSVTSPWGERTPYFGEHQWPARVDEQTQEEPERWVQSCCVLCTNGCGLDIGVKGNRIVGVRGRAQDVVNHGRLGPKGLHGWVANNSPDRLTRPLIRTGKKPGDAFREATWDEAMALMTRRCRDVVARYTPGAVAIYNSGQLFIEDYYTLSVIAHAGLRTNHIDGNTRLCTATAGSSLRETFGRDGQPSSYRDLDVADCILHVGHNIAATQTVSWMRILDRRRGPNPPRLVVIDPRTTDTAREADVHLTPRLGTNVALLNGLMHLLIQNGHVDQPFIDAHTVGFEVLREKVAAYPPRRVTEITGVPVDQLNAAARLLGTSERLLATVLQGVYQAHEATAAACQVNNLVLIRGMIGKPGCGVIQSNGQPTAQNTRETGADGEFPGFRNMNNPAHVADLARVWNVEPDVIPTFAPHTHCTQLFRLAEQGSIRMLWIIGTNPAVSVPNLPRIRKTLAKEDLFVVVQDAFPTETTRFADLVLPSAIWGEKTGTFTNADRTVHISYKAVDPPGEARPDMDVFVDFARRMGFTDKDGRPLIPWDTPEGAFDAWRACTKGQNCDYSGLTYARLTGGSGIQWPVNDAHPDGTERLYTDLRFPTGADACGSYGHDIETGAAVSREEYSANDPAGRAILKAADWFAPPESPDDEYPLWVTTGRLVYHFHTRTKTGRSPVLQAAAPDVFVQMSAEDAARMDVSEGEMVDVVTRRGRVRGAARIGDILPGHLFIPFHYGYWDEEGTDGAEPDGRPRAANELTMTTWDPVSKQPAVKFAAARLQKVSAARSAAAKIAGAAERAVARAGAAASAVASAIARPSGDTAERQRLGDYLGLLRLAHERFIAACDAASAHELNEGELSMGLSRLQELSRRSLSWLEPAARPYNPAPPAGDANELGSLPEKIRLNRAREGKLGQLRGLHELYVLAADLHITLVAVKKTAMMLLDRPLMASCDRIEENTHRQQAWLLTQVGAHAPQVLGVPF